MATTKKLLTRFDIDATEPCPGDFLIPQIELGQIVFRSIRTGTPSTIGLVVYLGVAVTENELFARLVESGAVIEKVSETLATLRTYLERVQDFRIGNVVKVTPIGVASISDFELELLATIPSALKQVQHPPPK